MVESKLGYRLEYAPSPRAKCKGSKPCNGTPIDKGELRLGTLIDMRGIPAFQWRHWGCVSSRILSNLRSSFSEVAEIDGYEELCDEDKQRVTRAWEEGNVADEDIPESARRHRSAKDGERNYGRERTLKPRAEADVDIDDEETMTKSKKEVSSSTRQERNTLIRDDGSNWFEKKDRTYNQLLALGLSSHLRGTVEIPEKIVRVHGNWYASNDTFFSSPLSRSDIARYEKKLDEYSVKEAQGALILMDILPTHLYLKIRHKPTLRDKWMALCDMFENDAAKGRLASKLMYELISTKYSSNGSMNAHLQHMQELEVKLAEVGSPVEDTFFAVVLEKSVNHVPELKNLIDATLKTYDDQGRTMTSEVIVNLLRIHEDERIIRAQSS
ncbi:hypothetical protein BJ165DRAFT_1419306 [Panaeolus papilionaceus]|nr:hypothetical protein BJ165DRAFT_1419306 [Panaeolus papilionaceus]